MNAIQEIVKGIKNLKPIPMVMHQILDTADNPECSIQDIARIIQYDPAITASVLKTCNSAFFGLKSPAESVKDAVSLLGLDQVVEIVLVSSGASSFSGRQKGYGMNEGEMWRYAVSSAVIAKQIATFLDMEKANMLFTATLLKDIGKIVLDRFVYESFDKISSLVVNNNMSFREAEKKVIGVDHTELGAMIAKMWKFSPKMVKIIRHHHLADSAFIKDREISVVFLADGICMMLGIGSGGDEPDGNANKMAMKTLALTSDDISDIVEGFKSQMEKIKTIFTAM